MSIGIDLGTTFSCVAIINPNNEPETIVNFNGNRTTPSVVAYEDAGELVGEAAVDAHRSIPLEHVIYGTFDVSILKCKGGGHFEILSSFGHMHLGGQDIDNILVEYALAEYNRGRARKFPEENLRKMKRLTESCTKAKIALSSHDRPAMIYMDMANEDDEFSVTITRPKFNELIGGMIRGTLSIVDQALSRASLTERDIDHVVSAKCRVSQVFLPNLFLK
ncbi:hypothetical protein WR25_10400 [Diploscapter pachys]|uniref:Uncharacterized protein n=1 Tax=Diploscapter pachys TaxID=2018661 RepID=A0A2A2J892_9BILA|nr:hypothetical protein WR25_10400 [Diploscapter pachys]